KISDILVIAGLAAFAYYKYSKLSEEEKRNIVNDIKETGRNIVKELIPEGIKSFLPETLK
ncbi:MAG TPA: hypothetical protein VF700_01290, partial [Segetibacter sp.]